MIAARVGDRLIGILSLSILARLLEPSDFGLLALAWTSIALIQMFGAFGLGFALIRKQDAERWHYDTAWTLKLIRGTVIVCLLLIVAKPAATFFHDPRIESIVYWLSLSVVFDSFVNIGVVDFRKHLNFEREVTYTLSVRFASALVTVLIVALWPTYWALVVGAILRSVIQLVLSYALHSFRPRFSLRGFHDIFGFSKWVFVSNTLSSIKARAPVLVLGHATGAEVLAFFTLANEVSNLPTRDLQAPVGRALFPGFSKLASERTVLVRTFLDSFALTLSVGLPLSIGIAVLAPEIVNVILGERWAAAIPILRVLALIGIVRSFTIGNQPIYFAVNRPRIVAALTGMELSLLAPTLLWGIHWAGAVGAAWALLFVSVVVLLVDYIVIANVLGISFGNILSFNWRIVTATLFMGLAIFVAREVILNMHSAGAATVLIALIVLGPLLYISTLFSLWRFSGRPTGPEALVMAFLAKRWREVAHYLPPLSG